MKIRIASDLHLEFNSSVDNPFTLPIMSDEKDTILILAGDICVVANLALARSFFADVCSRFRHVFYVFGNHEFYKLKCMKDACGHFYNQIGQYYYNLTFTTDGKSTKIDDYKFIMATLWTAWDHPQEVLGISNEYSMMYCSQNMGDFFLIRDEKQDLFNPKKSQMIHQQHIQFIKNELEAKDFSKSVVIVHHGPSLKSIHSKFFQNPMNPAFTSNLSTLWEELKPDLIVHGHTHSSFNYMDNPHTQIICNPKGYRGENPNFYPYLQIEL
jgi:predicted phosphodiesterase